MDTTNLDKLLAATAELLNCASRFIHKGGLISLWPLQGVISTFISTDYKTVLAEVKDLTDVEREASEKLFLSKVDLVDKNVQAKLAGGIEILEEVGKIVEQIIADGLTVYAEGSDVYAKIKALVS